MPNEPVQCPNCGSSDIRQLATESYICQHCHTRFHWVDPTKRTVVHENASVQMRQLCYSVMLRLSQTLV